MNHPNYQGYYHTGHPYQPGPASHPPHTAAMATMTHQLPALQIQPQLNMQQHTNYYGLPPPSPARTSAHPPPSPGASNDSPEDEDRIRRETPGPGPASRRWDGKIWALKMAQEPIKARMCGFGDKDRRPISAPPVLQLMVYDEQTGKEIDYQNSKLELSHLVCSVDIFDRWGRQEKNVVKNSSTSQSIGATSTGPYPTNPLDRPPHPNPQQIEPNDPMYATIHGQHPTPSPYGNGVQQNQHINGSQPATSPHSATGNYPLYRGSFSQQPPYPSPPPHLLQQTNAPNPYVHQSMSQASPIVAGENSQHGTWTRNLIGSLCTSAALLHDEQKNWGIYFIFQDLSVRTEDWFRLKFNFFNVGKTISDAMQTPTSTSGRANEVADSAPALASCFSQPFKVYSAKKFPGVADSTKLSMCFARQGMKISIRKDPNSGKRDRSQAGFAEDDGASDDQDNGEGGFD